MRLELGGGLKVRVIRVRGLGLGLGLGLGSGLGSGLVASVRARVSGQGQGDHAGRVVAHPLVTDGARARGRLAALESEQLLEAALFDLAGVRVRARSEAALVDLLRREAV